MNKVILLLTLFTSFMASAQFTACGKYLGIGEVKRLEKGMFLFVNLGSASEYKLQIPEADWEKVVPYIGNSSKSEIEILKKLNGYNGEIAKIISIERSILTTGVFEQNEDKLLLKQKADCLK